MANMAETDYLDPGLKELIALDKLFKSSQIPDKVEAIMSYSHYFVTYSSSYWVTSGFLKLAEYWRTSTNTIRQYILLVFRQSENSLIRVSGVNDMLRRIFVVLTSNDPVARGLTLRLFGYMASIVQDRIEVHHRIRLCLDTKDEQELDGALFATDRIAAVSGVFSHNIIDKLKAMMDDDSVDILLKKAILLNFRHMHYDQALAAQARAVCIAQLRSSADERFINIVLRTLTQLAIRTITHLDAQLEILLGYLSSEHTPATQWGALCNLGLVGRTYPQYIAVSAFEKILDLALTN
ncbi:hypothetical protein DFS34DRAFT_70184 [Phlyctochytrium arcticum]|nr:hypothetical protein DFS34DRAFT_70184 [Phlyctochytrium arcticum]